MSQKLCLAFVSWTVQALGVTLTPTKLCRSFKSSTQLTRIMAVSSCGQHLLTMDGPNQWERRSAGAEKLRQSHSQKVHPRLVRKCVAESLAATSTIAVQNGDTAGPQRSIATWIPVGNMEAAALQPWFLRLRQ